jgi:hypothetical protein
MSNRNRTAGHNWEREVVKDLKQVGFKDAVSSRYESKRLDDAGVDVVNTGPFNIQCKNETKRPDYHKLITEMPPGMNVVLHKYTKKSDGGKFGCQGKYAVVDYDTFLMLLDSYLNK